MHTTVAGDENEDIKEEAEEYIFHQGGNDIMSRDWLLLDNQSIMDQFVDPKYLTNVSKGEWEMTVSCNVGSSTTNQRGMFGNFRHNSDGIANVISPKTMMAH